MTGKLASVLWRIVALSDHHPSGTCWAWMDGAERVCGGTEDPATPHLCPRHARVARRRAEIEAAKAQARREAAAERGDLARLLAAESARVGELTAKLDRVREWIDRRGVSVSDRDDAYMAGYRDAQRHALHDAVDLRRILDADGDE